MQRASKEPGCAGRGGQAYITGPVTASSCLLWARSSAKASTGPDFISESALDEKLGQNVPVRDGFDIPPRCRLSRTVLIRRQKQSNK